MSRHYEAPALEAYGTLTVLTGSWKCTPATEDGAYHPPYDLDEWQAHMDQQAANPDACIPYIGPP